MTKKKGTTTESEGAAIENSVSKIRRNDNTKKDYDNPTDSLYRQEITQTAEERMIRFTILHI
jgi:hypothetical protein